MAFAAGGVADAVAEGVSGRLIETGDNEAFARAVTEQLTNGSTTKQIHACTRFAEGLAWPTFAANLREPL